MTPLRPTTQPPKSTTAPLQNSVQSNFPDDIENELITSYREENNFLRNLKAQSYLYSKLLGIEIDQEGNKINFSIKRTSTSGTKKLDFFLEESEENYVFTLKDSENCNIPEYFYDVIEFDKRAFPQFFYKAMQAVYETRTNE